MMVDERGPGRVSDGDEPQGSDEPLREEDVTAGDLLDDRVQEGEGLPPDDD